MEPDPSKASAADHYFPDTLHTRPQMRGIGGKSAFDPEDVAARLGLRNGSDLVHLKGQRFVRERRDDDFPGLTDLDMTDLALVDAKNDTVGIQRRHFEQYLTALYRGADQLAEIAGDDESSYRGTQLDPCELLVEQFDLRVGLIDLGADDIDRGRLPVGEGLVVFEQVLLAFGDPFEALERQV